MSPAIKLEEIMEKVITKYWERRRSSNDGDGDGDSTLVDGNVRRGNPRRPHEQSLCERCAELGRPCWWYGHYKEYITMASTVDSFMVIIDIYECFTVYV